MPFPIQGYTPPLTAYRTKSTLWVKPRFGNESDPPESVPPTNLPKNVPQPHFIKRFGQNFFDTTLNAFHLSVGLFLLAGLPFLHGHLFMALGAAIGLQLLQHYVRKKYPNTTVINAKQMEQVIDQAQQTYNKVVVEGGSKLLRKIPLIRRLEGPYARAAKWVGKVLKNGSVIMSRLMTNTVVNDKMPKSLSGKLIFITQMVLLSFIDTLLGPFGRIGQYASRGLIWLFRLKDVADTANAIKDSVLSGDKKKLPEPIPQPKDGEPPAKQP